MVVIFFVLTWWIITKQFFNTGITIFTRLTRLMENDFLTNIIFEDCSTHAQKGLKHPWNA